MSMLMTPRLWQDRLSTLAEELCRRLRERGLEGRTIGIKVRLDDWTNVTRTQTIESPTADPALVGSIALDLLRAYAPPRPVRLLGVQGRPVRRARGPRRERRSRATDAARPLF